jgi:D-serine deaminase-like pyridoxal phosphate-dependent protein
VGTVQRELLVRCAPTMRRADVPTPALLLDLDAFETNIAAMTGFVAARGKALRPHAKTHKCPEIARRLVQAGAVGACTAKLGEAEVFASHGLRGLLVTTAVVGPAKAARAAALAGRAPDTIVVADDARQVEVLNTAAANAGVRLRVAVDLYFGRTGVSPGEPARAVARVIASSPALEFAGLQAYDATASHTRGFEARRARTAATMAEAVATRRLLEADGLACPMVAAGSTGSYRFDAEIDGLTELQPGSFVFMDSDYLSIGGEDGGDTYTDFRPALTIVTTVVSVHGDEAIVDGGYKAFATDRPFTPVPVDRPDLAYAWAGDEHGRIDMRRADTRLAVGDRLEFRAPHCDPTVNLYDEIHALRGDDVDAVWAIAARGKSQ